jgi:Rps23 Pro-64 3,4-dihydroxylase Tpa1-like proline 4-hydroxylase
MIKFDDLEKNRYKIEQIDENIFRVENFITDQECKDLMLEILNKSDKDWLSDFEERYTDKNFDYTDQWYKRALNLTDSEYPQKLKKRLKDLINSDLKVKSFLTVQRHEPGSGIELHVDKKHDPKLEYAAVLYLNDDFNGGELYFPEKDIEIIPLKNSLIIFNTDIEYSHEVKKVLPGPTRYAIATFIWKP